MSERTGSRGETSGKAIGAQTLRFESPDLFIITLVGEITEAEAREMLGDIRRLTRGGAGYFELVDMTRLRAVPPAVRRVAVEPVQSGMDPILGVAIFGASFHLRVISSAIQRVLRLINHDNLLPLSFFGTRAEAQAWIDARRRSGSP